MSSRKGAGTKRMRPQKHKNTFAFKNDLHDKTPQMKKINSLVVCEVCTRCKEQIEWRIKYKKYKPLTQAKTCIKCSQRTVTKAYHVCCKSCAQKERICAKCLTSADKVEIEPPGPSPEEQVQLQVEMDRLIKSLSERKRRTFLRFMKKGQKAPGETNADEKDETESNEKSKVKTFVPHSRETLLSKIEALKLDEEDDDDDFSFGDTDDDFGEEEDDCEEEEDELDDKEGEK